jgi:carotenoid cleavage dioxygenase-like enzyme
VALAAELVLVIANRVSAAPGVAELVTMAASLDRETDADELQVEGTLPADIDGVFMRWPGVDHAVAVRAEEGKVADGPGAFTANVQRLDVVDLYVSLSPS